MGLVTLYLVWYVLCAALLATIGRESSVPPTWRDPDIPAGAEVVSVGEECGNGGCWGAIKIRPADGQSVRDLAGEMGLGPDSSLSYGWRPTNPASVSVFLPYGHRGERGLLTVGVSY